MRRRKQRGSRSSQSCVVPSPPLPEWSPLALLKEWVHSDSCYFDRTISTLSIGDPQVVGGKEAKRPLSSGSHDGTVKVWDVESEELAPLVVIDHECWPGGGKRRQERAVSCVAFQSNSSLLFTGGLDGTVRTWDLREQPTEPFSLLETSHRDGLSAIAVGSKLDRVVTAGSDGNISFYDGDFVCRQTLKHQYGINTLCISPAIVGAGGADGGSDYSILAGGGKSNIMGPAKGELYLHRETFIPEEDRPAPHDDDSDEDDDDEFDAQQDRVWRTHTVVACRDHGRAKVEGVITQVKSTRDGSRVVAGCQDGSVRMLRGIFEWCEERLCREADKFFQYAPVVRLPDSPTVSVAVSDDGKWVAAGRRNGSVHIWRYDTVREAFDKKFFCKYLGLPVEAKTGAYCISNAHAGIVMDLLITPELRLVSSGSDGLIRVWDLRRTVFLKRITTVVMRSLWKRSEKDENRQPKNSKLSVHLQRDLFRSLYSLPDIVFRIVIRFMD
jgi:WD40 repeat protein